MKKRSPHFVNAISTVSAWYLLLVVTLLCASCEKAFIDDDEPETPDTDDTRISVSFNVTSYNVVPFSSPTRTTQQLSDVCTRISFALFDASGNKVTSKNQTKSDSQFGTYSLSVQAGTYQLVVVAHSSTEGNATISSPSEIKFASNKLSDTFYHYQTLEIKENASYDITLQRAVAMFRLNITDATPADVSQMKFYYTGGSSTLDATTGAGCVNSKQTELRTVAASAHSGQATYEVYTFPHADGKKLTMKVTALSATGEPLQEQEYDNVPVVVNKITECTTPFFSGSATDACALTFSAETQWEGTLTYGN